MRLPPGKVNRERTLLTRMPVFEFAPLPVHRRLFVVFASLDIQNRARFLTTELFTVI
jgi:hypothetical protein